MLFCGGIFSSSPIFLIDHLTPSILILMLVHIWNALYLLIEILLYYLTGKTLQANLFQAMQVFLVTFYPFIVLIAYFDLQKVENIYA